MHLVIYGPEGSGKGTQAVLLSQKLNLPVITTGDLVREAAKDKSTRLGKAAREALLKGKYLSDEDVCFLVSQKLRTKEAKEGFILDGFPRTLKQAEFLDEIISKQGYKLDKVIYLRLEDDIAVERLKKRNRKAYEGSKVSHDDPQKIRERLRNYRAMEKEILKFYQEKNLLLEVDASLSVTEVFNSIISSL